MYGVPKEIKKKLRKAENMNYKTYLNTIIFRNKNIIVNITTCSKQGF